MDGDERIVFEDGEYLVTVVEDEPFWLWTIYREDAELQTGVSITEKSACSASITILRYFQGRL